MINPATKLIAEMRIGRICITLLFILGVFQSLAQKTEILGHYDVNLNQIDLLGLSVNEGVFSMALGYGGILKFGNLNFQTQSGREGLLIRTDLNYQNMRTFELRHAEESHLFIEDNTSKDLVIETRLDSGVHFGQNFPYEWGLWHLFIDKDDQIVQRAANQYIPLFSGSDDLKQNLTSIGYQYPRPFGDVILKNIDPDTSKESVAHVWYDSLYNEVSGIEVGYPFENTAHNPQFREGPIMRCAGGVQTNTDYLVLFDSLFTFTAGPQRMSLMSYNLNSKKVTEFSIGDTGVIHNFARSEDGGYIAYGNAKGYSLDWFGQELETTTRYTSIRFIIKLDSDMKVMWHFAFRNVRSYDAFEARAANGGVFVRGIAIRDMTHESTSILEGEDFFAHLNGAGEFEYLTPTTALSPNGYGFDMTSHGDICYMVGKYQSDFAFGDTSVNITSREQNMVVFRYVSKNAVGIEPQQELNKVLVFPNPTVGSFKIQVGTQSIRNIQAFDLSSKRIQLKWQTIGNGLIEASLEGSLPSGLYSLQIEFEDGSMQGAQVELMK